MEIRRRSLAKGEKIGIKRGDDTIAVMEPAKSLGVCAEVKGARRGEFWARLRASLPGRRGGRRCLRAYLRFTRGRKIAKFQFIPSKKNTSLETSIFNALVRRPRVLVDPVPDLVAGHEAIAEVRLRLPEHLWSDERRGVRVEFRRLADVGYPVKRYVSPNPLSPES